MGFYWFPNNFRSENCDLHVVILLTFFHRQRDVVCDREPKKNQNKNYDKTVYIIGRRFDFPIRACTPTPARPLPPRLATALFNLHVRVTHADTRELIFASVAERAFSPRLQVGEKVSPFNERNYIGVSESITTRTTGVHDNGQASRQGHGSHAVNNFYARRLVSRFARQHTISVYGCDVCVNTHTRIYHGQCMSKVQESQRTLVVSRTIIYASTVKLKCIEEFLNKKGNFPVYFF